MCTRVVIFITTVVSLLGSAFASGHGPVFGYATPVNSKGEWSFDMGLFGRSASSGSQLTARSMVSYGFTPHLQLSIVAPALIQSSALPMSAMSGGEFQGNVAWRFHRQPNAIGRRFESTASVGLVAPGPQDSFGMFKGIRSAPGVTAWAATGVASRSSYLWVGAGIMRFAERDGDRRPDVVSTSLVFGYRPRSWRSDAHTWDWRVFGEMTGEHVGKTQRGGLLLPSSDVNQVFVGPTVLGIYKFFAVSGGVQFPVYRDVGAVFPRERVRFAVNVSYFLFPNQHSR